MNDNAVTPAFTIAFDTMVADVVTLINGTNGALLKASAYAATYMVQNPAACLEVLAGKRPTTWKALKDKVTAGATDAQARDLVTASRAMLAARFDMPEARAKLALGNANKRAMFSDSCRDFLLASTDSESAIVAMLGDHKSMSSAKTAAKTLDAESDEGKAAVLAKEAAKAQKAEAKEAASVLSVDLSQLTYADQALKALEIIKHVMAHDAGATVPRTLWDTIATTCAAHMTEPALRRLAKVAEEQADAVSEPIAA